MRPKLISDALASLKKIMNLNYPRRKYSGTNKCLRGLLHKI